MTHNDSHLMALIDELKQSRNVMDQREVKTLQVIEGLLKRIERLEKNDVVRTTGQMNHSIGMSRY